MTLETTDSGRAKPQPPLPPKQKKWDAEAALKRIEAISVNARTTWFGLLALLTFVLVTLLGVQHIDFFGYGRATDLPLVNVSVPTERFFYAAPVLVAAVYAYFHFYLMKLWDELGQAEPQIDGRPIGDLVFPWLVVDGAMLLRTDGAAPRRALSRVSAFTSLTLTWLFGLGVLAYSLWQSLPAHDAVMSLLNCAALLFAGWVGVTSYIVMRRRLKYRMFGPRTERVWNGWRGVVGGVFCIAAMLAVWERSTNGASRFASDMWLTGVEKKKETKDRFGKLTRKRHLAIKPLIPISHISLPEAQLTEKPIDWLDKSTAERDFRKTWCSRRELPRALCVKEPDEQQANLRRAWCNTRSRQANGTQSDPRLKSGACESYFKELNTDFQTEWEERRKEHLSALQKPDLIQRNLIGADLEQAFLPGINLSRAQLEKANLKQARLEGANLTEAKMESVNLRQALLEGTKLSGAHLTGANLILANLEGADLRQARLEEANISGAHLDGANLSQARLDMANLWLARLRDANLTQASLHGANIKEAQLTDAELNETQLFGANLIEARLERADLSGALLTNADLSRARMEGTILYSADLQNAKLNGALIGPSILSSADLSGATGLTQEMLADAIGNEDTVLPAHNGDPLYVWSCWLEPPATFAALLATFSQSLHARLREQWLCGPEGREKTGRTANP